MRPAPCARAVLSRAAALGLLLAATPTARAEHVWTQIDAPGPESWVREPFGLVEVRGAAGTGLPGEHDVVVVIDLSGSTWKPSGADVDGDQVVGDLFRTEIRGQNVQRETDPDDSIAQAQVMAARRLVDRLDAGRTRLGLVVFGGAERILAELGAPRSELVRHLAALPGRPIQDGTYFYGALVAAVEMLERAPASGTRRQRSIILLSDGIPNRPVPQLTAEKASLRAARHAARASARIYAFAMGPVVVSDPGVFSALTEANGGELLLVERPGDVLDFVPHMSLTRLADVSIENRTTSDRARAVRIFPDGSFDGYVPLQEGENLLRIRARAESGAEAIVERRVHFEKIPDDGGRARALLDALRERTRETELAAEARRRRQRAVQRTLEITVQEPDGTGDEVPQEP